MSYKDRLIALHTGTSTEVDGVMQYTGWLPVLARNLQQGYLEGDYQAKDYATGYEGAQGEEHQNSHTRAQFDVDAAPSGTEGEAPAFDTLMKACGLSSTIVADTSVSYTPTPMRQISDTQVMQMRNGRFAQIVEDARGALSFSAEVNKKAYFGFNMVGAWRGPDAAEALEIVDVSAWPEALECSPANIAAFTFGGQELCLQSLSITDGRQPTRGKFMNCDGTDITGRNVTGRMTVRFPALADLDLISLAKAGTTDVLIFEIGTEAGSRLRVTGPKVQLKYAGEQDIAGEHGANIDLVFTQDQGDDEIAFIFT